jgi:hypothetical protein
MPDTELSLEEEMAQTVEETIREIEQRPAPPPGTPIVDTQADNMTKVAELLVKGIRDATAETCKRYLEVTATEVREALQAEEEGKKFTDALIAHTEEECARFLDFFERRRNAILQLTSIREMLAIPYNKDDKAIRS